MCCGSNARIECANRALTRAFEIHIIFFSKFVEKHFSFLSPAGTQVSGNHAAQNRITQMTDANALEQAKLIAAAPDLLAALRNIVMNDDGSPIAHVMASIARTAIAKAEA